MAVWESYAEDDPRLEAIKLHAACVASAVALRATDLAFRLLVDDPAEASKRADRAICQINRTPADDDALIPPPGE